MNKERLFIIIVAVCIFAVALFMIGGVIQDIDYHDLSKLPLLEQKAEYDRMQIRRTVGESIQLVGAILAFTGFVAVAVVSLVIGHNSAKEAEKKYAANK